MVRKWTLDEIQLVLLTCWHEMMVLLNLAFLPLYVVLHVQPMLIYKLQDSREILDEVLIYWIRLLEVLLCTAEGEICLHTLRFFSPLKSLTSWNFEMIRIWSIICSGFMFILPKSCRFQSQKNLSKNWWCGTHLKKSVVFFNEESYDTMNLIWLNMTDEAPSVSIKVDKVPMLDPILDN